MFLKKDDNNNIDVDNNNIDKFLPFDLSNTSGINQILKSTKKLVKNTNKYNNFIKRYFEKVQITSYKLPEVTAYPIFKHKELIPLSRTTYDSTRGFKENFTNSGGEGESVTTYNNPNAINPSFNPTPTKPHKIKTNSYSYTNVNFFRSSNKGSTFASSETSSRFRNFISPNTKTNIDTKSSSNKLSSSLPKIDFSTFTERKKSSRSIDLQHCINELDLFTENNSQNLSNLKYNLVLIFNRGDFYLELIKNKLSYFKKNKNENQTTQMFKKFNVNTSNEVHITLNSVTIEFKNLTDIYRSPFSFQLPLAFIPVFYYNDFETFKSILLAIVRFDDNFENIKLKEEEIYKLLNNMKEFETDSEVEGEAERKGNLEDIQLENKDNYETNHNSSNKSPKFSYFKKNRENIFKFNWITPKFVYEVEVRLPDISIYIPKDSKKVIKFIDSELLLYIYHLNFANWDFYVTNYLVSIKDFRNFINKTFSKRKIMFSKGGGTKLIINDGENVEYLFPSENKIKKYSTKESLYIYIFSLKVGNEIKNKLHKLTSFSLSARDDNLNYFNFDFNFNHMKMISRLAEERDLNIFFRKILIIDKVKQNIQVDYKFFDNLDETYFKISKSIYTDEALAVNRTGVLLETKWPKIEIYAFKEGKLEKDEINNDFLSEIILNKDFIKQLCHYDISKWAGVIFLEKPWIKGRVSVKYKEKDNKLQINTLSQRRKSHSQYDKTIKSPYLQSSKSPKITLNKQILIFQPTIKDVKENFFSSKAETMKGLPRISPAVSFK